MDDDTLARSVMTHLQQAHAMERAQLGELRALRDAIGIPAIAAVLDQHLEQTRAHGDRLEQRLEERDSAGSFRLLAQTLGTAIPKALVERIRPHDTRATLRDAIAAEAGEIASYLLLELEAVRAGDDSTGVLAAEIRADEVATRDELMSFWNQAVDHAIQQLLRDADPDTSETSIVRGMLVDHLRDVHALESNAVMMLSTVLATVHDDLVRARVEDHRDATMRHGDAVARRLAELGSGPSIRKQAQGMVFAALKGPINLVRAERAAKDMRDMYVVEQLEQVAYAQLAVLAERAGDERTLGLAQSHVAEEQAMAWWLEREAARLLLDTVHAKA